MKIKIFEQFDKKRGRTDTLIRATKEVKDKGPFGILIICPGKPKYEIEELLHHPSFKGFVEDKLEEALRRKEAGDNGSE